MKELTKKIRKEVKKVIEEVGGTENVLNKHILEIQDKIQKEFNIIERTSQWFEMLTTITNQYHYFKYSKGL